jgi:hypothetical protein
VIQGSEPASIPDRVRSRRTAAFACCERLASRAPDDRNGRPAEAAGDSAPSRRGSALAHASQREARFSFRVIARAVGRASARRSKTRRSVLELRSRFGGDACAWREARSAESGSTERKQVRGLAWSLRGRRGLCCRVVSACGPAWYPPDAAGLVGRIVRAGAAPSVRVASAVRVRRHAKPPERRGGRRDRELFVV